MQLSIYGHEMIVIYTTVANIEQAKLIAKTLLAERLVACVNMWPISSMCSWNEKIESSTEVAMFLKTTNACQEAVYQRVIELHSYECPAIITIDVKQSHPAFAQWVQTETSS